jgi:hypothetical protein
LCEQEETPVKSDEEVMAETQAEIAKLGAALTVLERLGTPAVGEEREAFVEAMVAVHSKRDRLIEWVKKHSLAQEERP